MLELIRKWTWTTRAAMGYFIMQWAAKWIVPAGNYREALRAGCHSGHQAALTYAAVAAMCEAHACSHLKCPEHGSHMNAGVYLHHDDVLYCASCAQDGEMQALLPCQCDKTSDLAEWRPSGAAIH